MNISDQQIKEIAGELDCGMVCYIHKETGEIELLPSDNLLTLDDELWQDLIDKIESNRDQYFALSPMDSNEAFEVMENFAFTVQDEELKNRLHKILNRPKPFANFKIEVDESDFREYWFAFKNAAYIKFVEEQIELEEEL